MIQSLVSAGGWSLYADDLLLAEHREGRPFATMIRLEKEYLTNRGSVKTVVRETERIPLTVLDAEENAVCFSGGGHRLRVTFSELHGGAALQFEGEKGWTYQFRLPAEKDEAVFGGGEQYRKVNLRGERVVNFVSEHIKASTILEKTFLPGSLYKEKPHSEIGSYAPMPVFVTDRKRLILFKTDHDGSSHFGSEDFKFRFDGCPEQLVLLHADSYEALSLLLAEQLPNRQYIPDWARKGMILGIQGGTETVLQKAFRMLDEGADICGVWCQDWSGDIRTIMGKQVWWNWEVNEQLYPDLKNAIRKLNARGVRFLSYINPYLVKDSRLYNACKEKGYLITKQDGSIYHIKSTTFDAGMLDLTNPDAVRFTKDVLIKKNMLDLGISGWMADFGEYLPVDCVLHAGDPATLHNRWPVLWAKLNREAVEEYGAEDILFFTRSGYLGIQEYAPILWNGDQHTDLTKDYGMPCVMPASFSLGFSGVPMVHCDIGGFFSFDRMHRSDELFVRWMEMSTFSLMMRSHESIRPWANAQFDAKKVLPHTVRLTKLHTALKPYLDRCIEDAQKGIPALRPDFWEAKDFSASRDEYCYYLGSDLFVCPVIEKKARNRRVCLPQGSWISFWSGKTLPGGREYSVPAPLGKIPVFYRKGSKYADLFRRAAEEYEKGETR